MKTLAHLPRLVIPAGAQEKAVSVDVRPAKEVILDAASGREHDLTLELDVEAERSPEAFYQVFVGRRNVGNVVLYGAGIRSEAHGDFHPAHVQLLVTEPIAAALRADSARPLTIRFVPNAPPKAALTIDKGEIVLGPRLRE